MRFSPVPNIMLIEVVAGAVRERVGRAGPEKAWAPVARQRPTRAERRYMFRLNLLDGVLVLEEREKCPGR